MNLSTKCFCVIGLALLFGCAASGGSSATTSLQFDDMAVPDGMTLLANPSHSYTRGEYRNGDFEYYGGVPVPEAVSYTRDRMKLDSWSLVSDDPVAAEKPVNGIELVFSKIPYTTTYKIWKDESVTRMTVQYRTNQ